MPRYITGLASVEYGTPTGTAAMPDPMTKFSETVKGSLKISESDPSVKDLEVEESDAPLDQIITSSMVLTASWNVYDIAADKVEVFKGGTVSTAKYSAPAKTVLVKKAIRFTDDNGVVFCIPNASCYAKIDGMIGKEDLLQMLITAKALMPDDGSEPWYIDDPV